MNPLEIGASILVFGFGWIASDPFFGSERIGLSLMSEI